MQEKLEAPDKSISHSQSGVGFKVEISRLGKQVVRALANSFYSTGVNGKWESYVPRSGISKRSSVLSPTSARACG